MENFMPGKLLRKVVVGGNFSRPEVAREVFFRLRNFRSAETLRRLARFFPVNFVIWTWLQRAGIMLRNREQRREEKRREAKRTGKALKTRGNLPGLADFYGRARYICTRELIRRRGELTFYGVLPASPESVDPTEFNCHSRVIEASTAL